MATVRPVEEGLTLSSFFRLLLENSSLGQLIVFGLEYFVEFTKDNTVHLFSTATGVEYKLPMSSKNTGLECYFFITRNKTQNNQW